MTRNLARPATADVPAPVRVFARQRLWRLDQAAFAAATDILAADIAPGTADALVGIARGGVPLARALAARLEVPFMVISARHNAADDPYAPASGAVSVDAAGLSVPAGARLALCDDICGSGATLTAVRDALTRRHAAGPTLSITLCRNDGATLAPDLWIWSVRDWVVFPWDAPPDQPTELLPIPSRVNRRRP